MAKSSVYKFSQLSNITFTVRKEKKNLMRFSQIHLCHTFSIQDVSYDTKERYQ